MNTAEETDAYASDNHARVHVSSSCLQQPPYPVFFIHSQYVYVSEGDKYVEGYCRTRY